MIHEEGTLNLREKIQGRRETKQIKMEQLSVMPFRFLDWSLSARGWCPYNYLNPDRRKANCTQERNRQ